MKMKVTLLSAISISFFAAATVSCVDTDKDLFDSEKTKELYEETFPVKNIDPSMDWKTTNKVSATVSVNEDYGVDYRVRIYTANPLISNSGAKLLAEGVANQDLKFKTDFDCPTSQTALYVLRTDEKKRNVLRIVDVESNQISTTFGESAATRANDELVVESYSPQYSETQLKELSSQAIEMTPGMILSPEVFYKVSAGNTFDGSIETYRNGTKNIIIEGTWNVPNGLKLENGSVLYVLNGGQMNLSKSLVEFVGSTHFAIYKGGAMIGGDGSHLKLANASAGYHNYNAGKIAIDKLDVNSQTTSKIFNYGEVDLGLYNATNSGVFVNHNIARFDKTNANSVIYNACRLTVEELKGSLLVGSKGSAVIDEYLGGWGHSITIGRDAMIIIDDDANFGGITLTGPTTGNALIKIGELKNANDFKSSGNVYYEIDDYGFNINNQYDSSTKAIKGLNISKPGEAPVYIPVDQLCTGGGNIPGEGEEIEDNPMKMTYAFEDNYPQVGDYDFNDIVLDVSTQYDREKSTNNIKRIQYNVTLTAVGAVKKLGAGLRLVGINKSEIESVTFGGATAMRNTLVNSLFENSIMESGDEVVIPLFGDAHEVYGYGSKRPILNTGAEQLSKLYTLEVIITLTDKSKTTPIITKQNLDFFIAYGAQKRTEVHLYEFMNNGATILGTVHPQNQAVAGKCTWAVCVPEFAYPKEYVRITNAYPDFESWAQDKNTNMDWYKYPVNDKIFDKIN